MPLALQDRVDLEKLALDIAGGLEDMRRVDEEDVVALRGSGLGSMVMNSGRSRRLRKQSNTSPLQIIRRGSTAATYVGSRRLSPAP